MLTKKKLKKLFKMLDKDKSGTISLQEIKNCAYSVKKGREDFIKSLAAITGITDDKEITLKEFCYIF